MPTMSPFLGLTLPLNNEFFDSWDEPLDENFTLIDEFAQQINNEIVTARGSAVDLNTRLSNCMDIDGNPLPAAELVAARSSPVYGNFYPSTLAPFLLNDRVSQADLEIFTGREGAANLRGGLAQRAFHQNTILTGTSDANGNPTWLGKTGANLQIDGTATPFSVLAGGYRVRTRILQTVPVSGASGTYFLWAQYQAGGINTVNGSATTNGTTGLDSNNAMTIFSDPTTNFTTSNVQPGDTLVITGTTVVSGTYIIRAVAPGGNVNQLQIYGVFQASLESLSYNLFDSVAPVYGVDVAIAPAVGKAYIGEATFDGTSVTAVIPYNFLDCYVSEWRPENVSGGNPTFTETFNHFLGTDQIEVSVQVSQANDGSQPVTELSNALLPAGAAISSGVVMQWTRTALTVKNALTATFYTDFNGTVQQSGFIRIIARKKN